MKCRSVVSVTVFLLMTMLGVMPVASAEDSKDTQALLEALGKPSTHCWIACGSQQRAARLPISAKFELEDGKLSLSVYTAGKGLSVAPERNVLQELSGSPDRTSGSAGRSLQGCAARCQIIGAAYFDGARQKLARRCNRAGAENAIRHGFLCDTQDKKSQAGCRVLVADGGKVKKLIQPL